MAWTGIIIAGLAATAVITAIMYMGPMMGMPKMDIAQMLGSMVLPQGTAALMMGMIMHFMMGILFVIIYAAVWNAFNNNVTWWSGIIFGLVHSMVAAVGMSMVMGMHKEVKAGRLENPMKAGGAKGMMGVIMGHIVFGLVAALVYGAFV